MAQMTQLRSTVSADGVVALSLRKMPIPAPGPEEVVVRVDAAPINPSDIGGLFAGALPSDYKKEGAELKAKVPAGAMPALGARLGKALPMGNEGGGVVVAAGSSKEAQALLGKTVGIFGGACYATHRVIHHSACLAMNPGVSSVDAASCFVNPLTALGMVDTMRLEGHTAMVHTAAASNLGQMLVKLSLHPTQGFPLVNVVRKPAQAALLRSLGAQHVVDSSLPTFQNDLLKALQATNATLAFDATGGGRLASDILAGMERAQSSKPGQEYSRYGSTTHKQVYIYGGLDRSPTTLNRTFGMAWGLGGWLLMPFLDKVGPKRAEELKQKVADEIKTTFASNYTDHITLEGMLDEKIAKEYGKMETGKKYLVRPNGINAGAKM